MIDLITGLPFIEYIAGALAIVIGLFGFGRLKKREGRKELEAEIATENLEEFRDASKKLTEVQRPVDAADARRKLRERQARRKR